MNNITGWIKTPKWWHERYGAELGHVESKVPVYPYADGLQYPATEYFYDGKDWCHPKLEYPAREYYKNERGEWIHDASCPWEKTWVPEN